MKIILISGKAGSGKDTTAKNIQSQLNSIGAKSIIIHFADYLKYIAKTILNWNGEKGEAGRELLQSVGERFRNYNEYFWVDCVINILSVLCMEYDYVLIPDWRYKNELEKMCSWIGGENVYKLRVRREFKSTLTQEQKTSISETELDNESFDYVIGAKTLCENIEQSNNFLKEITNGKY